MIEFSVKGLKEVESALKSLPKKSAKKALRSAVRAGGGVVRKAARANLPASYGTLKKSIFVKVFPVRNYSTTALIGPDKESGWYGHIVERGAEPHEIPKTKGNWNFLGFFGFKKIPMVINGNVFTGPIQHPGVKPIPFMARAFSQTQNEVPDAIGKKLWQVIEREAAKLAK